MLKTAFTIGGIVVLTYGGMLAAAYSLQRKLTYFPDTRRPDLARAGEAFREITVTTADGLALLAWYAPPAGADAPVVVYFQGNGGHLGYRADKVAPFLDAGLGVLLAGYRGYGGNPGTPAEAGLYRDAEAALDWLADQGVAGERLVLYGESLGTAVAVEAATHRRIGAIVLEAPFTSLADVGQRAYPWLPVRWLSRDRYDLIGRIGRIAAPVLVLHGEDDRIVPPAMGRAVLEEAQPPKHGLFLPGLGHEALIGVGAPGAVLDWLAALRKPPD